jgi:hypothetical protein
VGATRPEQIPTSADHIQLAPSKFIGQQTTWPLLRYNWRMRVVVRGTASSHSHYIHGWLAALVLSLVCAGPARAENEGGYSSTSREVDRLLLEATRHELFDRPALAIQALHKLLELDPNHVTASRMLAQMEGRPVGRWAPIPPLPPRPVQAAAPAKSDAQPVRSRDDVIEDAISQAEREQSNLIPSRARARRVRPHASAQPSSSVPGATTAQQPDSEKWRAPAATPAKAANSQVSQQITRQPSPQPDETINWIEPFALNEPARPVKLVDPVSAVEPFDPAFFEPVSKTRVKAKTLKNPRPHKSGEATGDASQSHWINDGS